MEWFSDEEVYARPCQSVQKPELTADNPAAIVAIPACQHLSALQSKLKTKHRSIEIAGEVMSCGMHYTGDGLGGVMRGSRTRDLR